MKIYLTPPQPSLGLERIRTALTRYKPEWVEVVETQAEADLVVIYAIGRRDGVTQQAVRLQGNKQKYAVIQVCLRSTMTPNTADWLHLWWAAEVVWSYYDLNAAIVADDGSDKLSNFYHAPLGADATVFKPSLQRHRQEYVIATSGLSRLSESVRECALAAEAVGRNLFHLGPDLKLAGHAICGRGFTDDELAIIFSACEFVSGLRRKEGFELPAVEGLLCGARPILFNSRDYRHWYEPWGEFIEEGTRQEVIDQLVELFKRGARPVTAEERAVAVERFNWETIVRGFYERLGH